MILRLIQLTWKENIRSSFWQKSVVTNIFIGFIVFILMLYLLALGVFIDEILLKLFPDRAPIDVFNGALLYYFGFDLFVRYMMQSLPTFSVEAFLHLPVKKTLLIHFLIVRSFTSLLNFLPLLVFIPFSIKVIAQDYNGVQVLGYLLTILVLIFNNNLLATWIKRQLVGKASIVAWAGGVLLTVFMLDYFGVFSLSAISTMVFDFVAMHPASILFALGLAVFTYSLNFQYLKSSMYPEELVRRKSNKVENLSEIRYLKELGLTGTIIGLEMKLWLRHKRTKSMLYMLPLFVLYGLFFYPNPLYKDMSGFLIFVGIFMSGGLMINYLNYSFGYESNYFDYILSSRIDLKNYLKVKLYIGIILSTFCFIITIPYVFFGWHILLINTVTWLFNIGFLSVVLLYTATYNKKAMDLTKGAAFNYQGIGAGNWLAMLPAFLLPVLIYLPFSLFGYPYAGLMFIGILGLIMLLLINPMIKIIEKQLISRRYIMAESFRNN